MQPLCAASKPLMMVVVLLLRVMMIEFIFIEHLLSERPRHYNCIYH